MTVVELPFLEIKHPQLVERIAVGYKFRPVVALSKARSDSRVSNISCFQRTLLEQDVTIHRLKYR